MKEPLDPKRVTGFAVSSRGNIFFIAAGPRLVVQGPGDYVGSRRTSDDSEVTAVMAVGDDGVECAFGVRNGSVLLGHPDDPVMKIFRGAHEGAVRCIAGSNDGKSLATCSDDGKVKIWSTSKRHLIRQVAVGAGVRSCVFSPDDGHLVLCLADAGLVTWEVGAEGSVLHELTGHQRAVNGAAVMMASGGELRIVSASDDRSLKVWSVRGNSGSELATLRGHRGPVLGCLLTPDGRHVLSWSMDRTLCLWSLETYRRVATTYGTAAFISAKLLPDGRVCALDAQGALWILRLAVEEEVVEKAAAAGP